MWPKILDHYSGRFFRGRDLPQPLPAGNYTVAVSEIYSDTYDSNGVLYFLSSGYAVDDLVFGKQYTLSNIHVNLLKFTLNEARTLVANTSAAGIVIYDGDLNVIDIDNLYTPTVFAAGNYFAVGYNNSINQCRYDRAGLFSLIDLGAVGG